MTPKELCKTKECDVHNHDLLDEYREKRSTWIDWLHMDDPHAIWSQIYNLAWDDVFFRTINHGRLLNSRLGQNKLNSSLIRLLETGHIASQTSGIRRLVEVNKRYKPDQSILSIRRLIDELEENVDLITRENYVCYDGSPYNPTPSEDSWLIENGENNFISRIVPNEGPGAWLSSYHRHEAFDMLSIKEPSERSRTDKINTKIFSKLKEHLGRCGYMKTFNDKFIAHASHPENRKEIPPSQLSITLDKLTSCIEAIFQVTSFIDACILWNSSVSNPVPSPQYDHLENLDWQLLLENSKDNLATFWNKEVEKRGKWKEKLEEKFKL
ncbi:MAG: hypothetical protein R3A45_08750 [Bdellovibrionota bacterium]